METNTKTFAQQLKDLNNYKGKEIVVHARRTHLNKCVQEDQYFVYKGKIHDKTLNKIGHSFSYFILDCDGVDIICNFNSGSTLHNYECTVITIDDAKTGETILKNIYEKKEPQNELVGSGIISGVKGNRQLENYVGEPGVLLEVHDSADNEKYMKLLLSNGVACHTNMPKTFSLKQKKQEELELIK